MNLRLFVCLLALVAVQAKSICNTAIQAHVTGRLTQNSSGHWLASATLQETTYTSKDSTLQLEAIPKVQRSNGARTRSITLIVSGDPLPPTPGYIKTPLSNSYYKVHEEVKTWEEAKKICEEENAHLLILNSKDEAEDIKKLLKNYPHFSNYLPVGITDREKEGTWVTIFGESLVVAGYNIWDAKEPASGRDQNCGSATSSAMNLHDWTCNEAKESFVCEQIS